MRFETRVWAKRFFIPPMAADELPAGTLPDVPAVVNFGPGEAKKEFAKLQKFRPGQPMMSGEYWDGWFDHWGEAITTTDVKQQAQELDWILSQGYSDQSLHVSRRNEFRLHERRELGP